MVAIVNGGGLGLFGGSANVLGNQGVVGDATSGIVGGDGAGVYVNATNGNLMLQARDEFLASLGFNTALVRTYNSQGLADDGDNHDNWRMGALQSLSALNGVVNTAGSSVTLTRTDGSLQLFTYDAARGLYLSTAGGGAFDTLTYQGGAGAGMYALITRGANNQTETYNAAGFIVSNADADGNTTTYGYGAQPGLVTSVTLATGDVIYLDYTGTNLAAVRTVSNGVTQTRDYYSYDAKNRLTKVTVDLTPDDNSIADNAVYSTVYTYDGDSNRIATISADNLSKLKISYVLVGTEYRVASLVDAQGYTTSFTYDLANGRTDVSLAGAVTSFTYDSQGQLLSVMQPAVNGVRSQTSFTYDASGNVTQLVDGNGNVLTMEYDAMGNQTAQRDAMGNLIERTYNSANQVLTEARSGPSGALAVTRNVYDSHRHLVYSVSAEGRVTELMYNAAGEQTAQISYAAGTFDVAGLAPGAALTQGQMAAWAALQDKADTQRVDLTYDFRGQLASSTSYASVDANGAGVADSQAATTRYVYDQHARLLQSIDPRDASWVATYVYDGLDRITSSSDALANRTTTTYVTAANRTITRNLNGLSETSVYDAAGHLLSVTQSGGAAALGTLTYTYNAAGKMDSSRDANGVKTRYLYDAVGRPSAIIDGLGDMTEYAYDGNGNVISTTQYALPAKVLTSSQAVTLENLRPAASAADRVSRAVYDQDNRLSYTVDAAGYVTQRIYDAASRVVEVVAYATALDAAVLAAPLTAASVAPAAAALDRHTRNFYDGDGRLAGQLDAEGYLTSNQYDGAGNFTGTTRYAVATDSALRASGTLAQLTPAAAAGDIRTRMFYNARGQTIASLDAEAYLTEIGYDRSGNITSTLRYATPVDAQANIAGATLAQLRPKAAPAADHLQTFAFTALNQLASVTDIDGSKTIYGYDNAGDLTSTTVAAGTADARTTLSQYDLQGHKIAELSAVGASLLTGDASKDAAVWSAYATTYKYDLAGRLVQSIDATASKTSYFYDLAGHQTHVVNGLGEVSGRSYDAFGEVISTTQYVSRVTTTGIAGGDNAWLAGRLSSNTNDTTLRRDYDVRGATTGLLDAMANLTTRSYDAFGDVLRELRPANANGARAAIDYTYDRRGLATSQTDSGSGLALQSSVQYDAFGRAIASTDAAGHVRTQTYDRDGRVVVSQDALNVARGTTYDAFDRVLTQSDGNGNITRYSYDDAARRVTVTTADGVQSTITRNREGQQISLTDGKGNLTSYAYDKDGNLTATTDALGDVVKQAFDAVDRVASRTDANGKVTTYTYDAANRVLAQTVDADGLKLKTSYTYDGKGEVITVTDPKGIITTTTYTRNGEVVRTAVDVGGVNLYAEYTYDGEGRVLSVADGSGSTQGSLTQYVYDQLGRLIQSVADPKGLKLATNYQYDALGNAVMVTDANGHVTAYTYDAENRVVSCTDAMGGVTRYAYDANGNRISATDANGGVTRSAYDTQNRLVSTTDQLGATTRYAYDADGNLVATTDALGQVRGASYDKLNRPLTVTDALGGRSAYTYDATGNRLSVTDPLGHVTKYSYDGANRVVSQTDAVGNVEHYVYDAAGNRTEVQDGRGVSTIYSYDAAGRVVNVSSPGSVTKYSYDAMGNVQYVTNGKGYRTYTQYDGANRLIRQDDLNGARTTYAYDAAGNRISMTDPLGHVTSYTYDANNRMVSQTDPLGAVTDYGYDALGNRTLVTDATGASTTYAYDANNRLVSVTDPLGHAVSYGYDASGNRIQVTDANGHVASAQYDANGRLSAAIDALGQKTSYAYDVAGNRTRIVDANGYATLYAYDGDNRLTQTTDALGAVESYTYDTAGNRASVTDKNGNTTTYLYDGSNRLILATDPLGLRTNYAYDAAGNVSKVWLNDRTSATTYEYDAANRLLRTVDEMGNAWRYEYNTVGSRTLEVNAKGSATYQYDADNRLISGWDPVTATATKYVYDAAGRQTAVIDPNNVKTTFTYDAAGRQLTVDRGLGDVTSYTYDATGNRLSSTDGNGNVTSNEYDANNRLLAERDALGNVTRYAYDAIGNRTLVRDANGRDNVYVYDAENRLVSWTNGAGERTAYQYDAKGNQVEVTDGNGNSLHYDYDAAGHVLVETGGTAGIKTYTYDQFGNRSSATDANGGVTTYAYDLNKRLILTTDPLGFKESYTYDGVGNRTGVTDSNGHSEISYYDQQGRLKSVSDALGNYDTYYYDTVGNLVQWDPRGGGWYSTLVYSPGGQLLTITDELGGITRYKYDIVGNRTEKTDPLGKVTKYEYDADNRLITETDGAGDVTRYSYDAVGNRIGVDVGGRSTRYEYDGANRLVAVVDAMGGRTSYQYDKAGKLIATTDGNGNQTRSVYDDASRLVSQVDGNGEVTAFEYDAKGNRTALIDANGNRATYEYDAADRLIRQTDALGQVTGYQYDPVGNLLKLTDANGGVTSYTYDPNDRMLSETDPLGNTTTYAYDTAGNRSKMIDAKGAITNYSFDYNNRPTGSFSDLGLPYEQYVYDKAGNVIQRANGGTAIVQYTYDAANRVLTESNYYAGLLHTYTYDDAGNRITSTDANGNVTRFAYDANNRLVSTTVSVSTASADLVWVSDGPQNDDDQNGAYWDAEYGGKWVGGEKGTVSLNVTRYEYDAVGNRTALIDANGNKTVYAYDASNRLITATDALGGVSSYTYDGLGNQLSVTDQNGHATTYLYDAGNHLLALTDALGHSERYSYDELGNRTSYTDQNGNVTSYAFDADNRLVGQTDAFGNKELYTYDSVGNRVSSTDKLGNVTTYTYDLGKRLIGMKDALGNSEKYTYDGLNNLLTTTDKNGKIRYNYYDSLNRLFRTDVPSAGTITYAYDAVGNLISKYDGNQTTKYEYDALNRLVKTIAGVVDEVAHEQPGTNTTYKHVASTRYVYDGVGNVVTEVDSLGHEKHYTYDAANRLIATSEGENETTATEASRYDAAGNLISHTDANGNTTSYAYDAVNRLMSTTDPLGKAELIEYDAQGNRTKLTDRNGNATTYVYDAAHRLLSTTDSAGFVTSSTYDALGNVTGTTDRNGEHTAYLYDADSRLIKTVDPMGLTSTIAYDAVGNRTVLTDRNGNITTLAYDGNNRLVSRTDALGGVEKYTYDNAGNRTSVTDTNGKSTYYVYDAMSRLSSEHDASYLTIKYEYDTNGNLTLVTDPLGNKTRYTYDANNRVKWKVASVNAKYVSGSGTHSSTLYQYDAVGNLVSQRDPNHDELVSSYDANNQLIGSGTPTVAAFAYTYDAVGNRLTQTDGNGHVTSYAYDSLNRLLSTTDPLGLTTVNHYDAEGNRTDSVDSMGRTTKYQYDADYRLVGSTGPDGARTVYTLDNAGNHLTETTWYGTAAQRITSYTYDALNRATSKTEADGTVTSYVYDHVGNVLSQSVSSLSDPASVRLTVYTYDAHNRQLTSTLDPKGLNITESVIYDAAGNVTQKTDGAGRVWVYEYDSAGHVGRITDSSGLVYESYKYDLASNISEVRTKNGTVFYEYDAYNRVVSEGYPGIDTVYYTRYTYDAAGNRTVMTDPNGVVTHYYYDADQRMVAELDGDHVLHEYQYDAAGNKTVERLYMTRLTDVGGGAARPVAPAGEVRVYSFEYDVLGRLVRKVYPEVEVSSVAVVDGAPQVSTALVKPEERTAYDAYGNVTSSVAMDGGRTLTWYDVANRPVAQVDAMGYLTQYDYDNSGNVLQKRVYATALDNATLSAAALPAAPAGQVQVTSYLYDAANQMVQQTSAPVLVTQQDSTADAIAGLLNQSTASIVTQYVYDKAGNVIRTINAAGTAAQQTVYSYYDKHNWLLATIDGNRGVTFNQYDGYGRLTGVARVAKPVYDSVVDLTNFDSYLSGIFSVAQYSDADQATLYAYDERGLISSETTALRGVSIYGQTKGTFIVSYTSAAIKRYSYDAAGNRIKVVDALGNTTAVEYDGLNRSVRITQPDGSNTRQYFDAAGNVIYSYTGETANNATVAQQIKVTAGATLAVDYDLGTAGLSSYVIWDTVSHDIANAGSVADYANRTQVRTSLGSSAGHGEMALPAAGSTLYYRVVTIDAAGNMAYTSEQKVTMPLSVPDVQVDRLDAGTLQVRVNFGGGVSAPQLAYGVYGTSNYTAVALTTVGDGYYVATFPAGTNPDSLGFKLQWTDASGAALSSGEQALKVNNHAFGTTVVATGTLVDGGGVAVGLVVTIPASLATGYPLLTAGWRLAGSGADFSSAGGVGVSTGAYQLNLGGGAGLKAGQAYEIVLRGVDAEGKETLISSYSYTPSSVSGATVSLGSLSWDAPGVGSGQLVIVGGQPVASSNVDGRIVSTVPAGTKGNYEVYYTDKVATAHSTAITSTVLQEWVPKLDAQGVDHGAFVVKGYNLGVKTTLAATEAVQVVGGLHISWRDSGSGDGISFATDALMTANADGSYSYSINQLAAPAKSLDYKLWYLDTQGRQVIVDWSKTSTDASASHNSTSDIVRASATGGTITGVAVTPGTYLGRLANTGVGKGIVLDSVGTGLDGGLVNTNPTAKGYFIESQYNALDVKTASSGDDGVWTEYGVDVDGNAVQTRVYGTQGSVKHIDSYAEFDLRGRQTALYGAAFETSGGGLGRPVTRTTYDFMNNAVSRTDATGTATAQYDALGRLVLETDVMGYTKVNGYDALGNLVSQTDQNGNTSFSRYDGAGHRIQTIDATGRVQTEQRDAFGRLTATIDGNGKVRAITYDQRNNVLTQDGTAYEYDLNGNRLAQHDVGVATGHRREYTYDAMGRIKSETVWEGKDSTGAASVTQRQYDVFGNLIAEIDGAGHATQSIYGGFARQESGIDASGEVISYSYDAFGRKVGEVGSNGRHITYAYDDAGHLTEINDLATGTKTSYRYDVAGRQVQETVETRPDATNLTHNRAISTTYDALGRMTHWIDSVTGLEETISYDHVGNQVRVQGNGSGGSAAIDHGSDFDQAGRLIALRDNGQVVATYSYDAAGNRHSYSEGDLTTVYTYDAQQRPLTAVTTNVVQVTLDASYISFTPLLNPNGQAGQATAITQGGNDVALTVREALQIMALQQYHDAAQWTRIAADNGISTADSAAAASTLSGRVINITHTTQTEWQYDNVGNTTMYRESQDGVALKTVTSGYNDASQNISSKTETTTASTLTSTDTQTLARAVHAGSTSAPVTKGITSGQVMTQEYGVSGQVARSSLRTYSTDPKVKDKNYYYVYAYTADGRQQSVRAYGDATGTTNFTYDVDHNLVQVNQGKGDGMDRAEVASYVYDNVGNILYKNHDDGQEDVLRDKLEYVYVNGHPVAETGVSIAAKGATTVLDSDNYALFQNYDQDFPAASVFSYTVHAGETLKSIADAVYGDSSLWYVLAAANGLSADAELEVGQVLTVPAKAQSSGVTSDTHTVYNQSDIVGGTLPNLASPPPSHPKCAGLLKILVIVVAVVVAAYVGPEAAEAIGTALGGGTTAVAVGAVAGAAVGAAAGSIVSQGVAIGVGLQESFDWKAVGKSAIEAAVSAGVGGGGGSGTVEAIGRGVVRSVITQGAEVLVGLQDKFNWREAAAAGAAAGASNYTNNSIGATQYGAQNWALLSDNAIGQQVLGNDFARSLVRQTVSGVASSVAQQVIFDGKIQWPSTLINGFGDALGQTAAGYRDARAKLNGSGRGNLGSDELLGIGIKNSQNYLPPIEAVEAMATVQAPSSFGEDVEARAKADPVSNKMADINFADSVERRRAEQAAVNGAVDSAAQVTTASLIPPPKENAIISTTGSGYDYEKIAYLADGGMQITRVIHPASDILTKADKLLGSLQDYVTSTANEMDDIASAANATTGSQLFAAATYGVRHIARDTINAVVGIPRLATSDTIVPNLVRAAQSPTKLLAEAAKNFLAKPLQDQLVTGVEVVLPMKAAIENAAARIPRVGKYLQGEFGYTSDRGIVLTADGKVYGALGDGVGNAKVGQFARQAGSVASPFAVGEIGVEVTGTDAAIVKAGGKPAWLERLDKGNKFNAERENFYEFNEVYINNPRGSGYTRLDSYSTVSDEIISRKFTQLSDVKESTALGYVGEVTSKYPVGAKIADVPSNVANGLAGKTLKGQYVLEVPVQVRPVPKAVIDAAEKAGILIRDVNGRIY